ncbi:MAG TPA: acetyltransferase [Trueperaceae bacterium]|nr:acetyltransferase [Trueperaceae bacterium]
MPGADPLWIIGAGGHAKVVLATARALGLTVAGLLEDRVERHGSFLMGVQIVGDDSALPPAAPCVIAIGDQQARKRLASGAADRRYVTLLHPQSVIADGVGVAEGTVVLAGAVVQVDADIGRHVIVNTGAIVEHDCVLADLVQVASGAVLTGAVAVGEGAFIGAGAVVLPKVRIGAWSVIGAGAVVTRDVPEGATVIGVPARPRSGAN